MSSTIRQTNTLGYDSLVLETSSATLAMPIEVGPRVLHAGLKAGPNLFATLPEQLGKKGESEWMIRGGHRLWHSPEHPQRTYAPDNSPIKATKLPSGNGVLLEQETEALTGLAKSMQVEALGDGSFKLTHKITNKGLWSLECAAWALSVLTHGGYAVVPFLPKGQHPRDLLPNAAIVPWTYTDLTLPVWNLRKNCLGIDVTKAKVPQKLGITNYPGWSAYWQAAGTFAVYSPVCSGSRYPDLGCAFETFCNDWMIELETLSPLAQLEPGQTITHVEYWGIFADLQKPDTESAYEGAFLPAIQEWLASLK